MYKSPYIGTTHHRHGRRKVFFPGGPIVEFFRRWPRFFQGGQNDFSREGSSGEISFQQLETKRKTFFN